MKIEMVSPPATPPPGGQPRVELIRDDGLNLGLELVRRGLAKVSKSCNNFAYGPAEADAIKAALGLWSTPPHTAE